VLPRTREEREYLRTTFEEVPELYDRARPAYPEALFDDLAALAGLGPGSRVLEIGCGTGQATIPLARRGFDIVCVELGTRLAEVARRNLAPFPRVQVVNADFETWEPEGRFDAVVAFSAFHWLDPDEGYAKAAGVLREGGSLAVAGSQHVLPDDGDSFFAEVQDDYDAVVPSDDNRPPPRPEQVDDWGHEIEASGYFRDVAGRRYVWELVYSSGEYVDLLSTYSGHRSIEEPARRELLDRIRRRIESRPGGRIRKTYLAILHVARRR
jgi:SAM-dependent methyltransferase